MMRRAGLFATGSNCGLSCICGDKIAPVASACGGLGELTFRRDFRKDLKLWLGRGAHLYEEPQDLMFWHPGEAVQESSCVFFRIFD